LKVGFLKIYYIYTERIKIKKKKKRKENNEEIMNMENYNNNFIFLYIKNKGIEQILLIPTQKQCLEARITFYMEEKLNFYTNNVNNIYIYLNY